MSFPSSPAKDAHPSAVKQRIMLIEDDRVLATMVAQFLEDKGFQVTSIEDGKEAVNRILSDLPDAVVLDIGLPGMDGLEVCRAVRPRYVGPILILTARGDEVDQVVGLELGADDYLVKPVRPRVLLAHLRALLRRSTGYSTPSESQIIVLDGLSIDLRRRTAELDKHSLELTTAEFELLWYLASRAGDVVSRTELYQQLCGIEYDGLDRTMDLRISRLRRKLGDDSQQPERIKSVRGVGYILVRRP